MKFINYLDEKRLTPEEIEHCKICGEQITSSTVHQCKWNRYGKDTIHMENIR
jgi:hypothetical protein